MSRIIGEKELKESFDCGTRPALVRFLAERGINFSTTAKGQVWTVQAAIDKVIVPAELDDPRQECEWEYRV